MRFSCLGLIRMALMLGLASGALAVVRARLEPTPSGFREVMPPRYETVNDAVINGNPCVPQLIDARAGTLARLHMPEGDRLSNASGSPWRDEEGNYQIVGRWSRCEPVQGTTPLFSEFGIARYSFPEGRMLNRIALDVVPMSHPCWAPGTEARVVFAAGDGKLYTIDFDRADREGGGTDPETVELSWRCDRPPGTLLLRDPVWPSDPRFKGRLIVALQVARNQPAEGPYIPSRLWWVELGGDGCSIVNAGPLAGTDAGADEPGVNEERLAAVADVPGVGPMIAYLCSARSSPNWELRLAPLMAEDDGRGGLSAIRAGNGRTLALGHLPSLPTFSADGRWVFAVLESHGRPEVVRFPSVDGGYPVVLAPILAATGRPGAGGSHALKH
jgi:hypothetical protein